MAVSHILASKGRSIITASPYETIQAVAARLSQHKIGAVLVLQPDTGHIEGIVSERDIVRVLGQQGAAVLEKPVATIMSTAVKTCKPGDSEVELMALMTEHRIRHLPVIDGGHAVGMISIGDVVKNRIEAIEREAEDMKSYISSAG